MEQNSQTNSESKEKPKSQAFGYAIGELCFVFLPFIVMVIVFCYKADFSKIFKEAEWSLAASVMFGQSIIKLMHTITKYNGGKKILSYNVGAILAVIISFGLVPSLTSLALIYNSDKISYGLVCFQIILFILAVIVFYLVNRYNVESEEDEEKNKQNASSANTSSAK